MKNKIVYYYREKYPAHGIKQFEADDIEYRCYESDDADTKKRIVAIESYYDINYETRDEEEYIHTYSVYQPYEDEEIYVHDREAFSSIIMSFNKKAIERMWINDIRRYERIHGEYVDKCREILKKEDAKNV